MRDFYVADGRFITEDDINKKALVVVLGCEGRRQQLFGDKDPIGESMRVTVGPGGNFSVGFNFTVIGVMEEKGSTSSTDQDNVGDHAAALIPGARAVHPQPARPHERQPDQHQAHGPLEARRSRQEITDMLRKRHNLAEGTEDDFTIQSQSDVLSTATSVDRTLSVLLVSIALISLSSAASAS